jgi:hypothetical protein
LEGVEIADGRVWKDCGAGIQRRQTDSVSALFDEPGSIKDNYVVPTLAVESGIKQSIQARRMRPKEYAIIEGLQKVIKSYSAKLWKEVVHFQWLLIADRHGTHQGMEEDKRSFSLLSQDLGSQFGRGRAGIYQLLGCAKADTPNLIRLF